MKPEWRTLLNPIVGAVTAERARAGLTTIKPRIQEEGHREPCPARQWDLYSRTDRRRDGRTATAMMFPSLIAPPAVYPSLLRPTPTLTLPQSLQSAFSSHSSFLVEDLIRISRPGAYPPRSAPPPSSMSPPASAPRTDSGTPELPGCTAARRICSSQSSGSDSTFLKFGVNAILSSTPRAGKRPHRGKRREREGAGRTLSPPPT